VAPAARARTAGSDWIAAAVGGKNGGTDMLAKVEAPRSAAELRARYRGARDRLMGSADPPAAPALPPAAPVRRGAPPLALPWALRPHWESELEDFNERLRALFVGNPDAYARPFNGRTVRDIVARHFGITVAELVGAGRTRRHSWPRQIAIYLCLIEGGMRYSVVQQIFNGRDHSTLRASVRVVRARMQRDPDAAAEIGALVERCKQVGVSA
jgi:Bacterial dnaA protein helix-turn-helix